METLRYEPLDLGTLGAGPAPAATPDPAVGLDSAESRSRFSDYSLGRIDPAVQRVRDQRALGLKLDERKEYPNDPNLQRDIEVTRRKVVGAPPVESRAQSVGLETATTSPRRGGVPAIGSLQTLRYEPLEGFAPEPPQGAEKEGEPFQVTKGFKGALLESAPRGVGRALEAIGVYTGVGSIENAGRNLAERFPQTPEYEGRVPSVAKIRVDSVGNFAQDTSDYLSFQLGSGLGSTVPSLIAGALTSIVTRNPRAGMALGAAGPSYVQNLGDVYDNIVQDDGIKAAIANGQFTRRQAAGLAVAAAVPIAMLDAWSLGENIAGFSGVKQAILKGIVSGIKSGMIREGTTEGLQEVISQVVQTELGSNKPLADKAISVVDNAVAGALVGGATGGVGGGVSAATAARRGKAQPPTAPPAPGLETAAQPPSAPQSIGATAAPPPDTTPIPTDLEGLQARRELEGRAAGGALPTIEGAPPEPSFPMEGTAYPAREQPLPKIDKNLIERSAASPVAADQRLQEDVQRELARAEFSADAPSQPSPPTAAAPAEPAAGAAPVTTSPPPSRRLNVFLGEHGQRQVSFPDDGDKIVFRLAALERAMGLGRKPYSKGNTEAAKSMRTYAAQYLGVSKDEASRIARAYRDQVIEGARGVPADGMFTAPTAKQPKPVKARSWRAPVDKAVETQVQSVDKAPETQEQATVVAPSETPATDEVRRDLEEEGVPPAIAPGLAETIESATPAPGLAATPSQEGAEAPAAAGPKLPSDTSVTSRKATKEERAQGNSAWRAFASTNEGGFLSVSYSGETEQEARDRVLRYLARKLEQREEYRRPAAEPAKKPVAEQVQALKDKAAREKERAAFGAENKVFTKDKADAARALLKKKLGQVSTGLDPEIVQAGIQLAGYWIEGGARSFAAYSKRMIDDLGEAVRPYLKSWYAAVYYHPGFDNAGMDEPGSITEAKDAGEVRGDAGQVQERGDERARGEEKGREDLQRPEEGGRAAGGPALREGKTGGGAPKVVVKTARIIPTRAGVLVQEFDEDGKPIGAPRPPAGQKEPPSRVPITRERAGAAWDSLDYGAREKIAQGSDLGGMRRVVHRIAGSKWADLSPGEQDSMIKSRALPVDVSAHQAATSPKNDLPEPTPAQKEAGNYPKGHVRVSGLDVSIENPEGSTRSGTGPDGRAWSVKMKSHYGYVRGTESADGDHVDIFIKPGTPLDYDGPVFVIDQTKRNGHFDEHKIMLGWPDEAAARAGFIENYDDPTAADARIRAMTPMTVDQLKAWLAEGDTKKAVTGTAADREALIGWVTKAVLQAFRQSPTISTVRRMAAEKFGTKFDAGTEAAKQLDEAIEAAVVREARRLAGLPDAYPRILGLYEAMPTLGVRTSDSIERQAYSTPVPLAYIAGKLAGLEAASSIYEPSAGNGALLILARPGQQVVYANEIDPERAAELDAQGWTETTTEDATARENPTVDVVIANPPFGAVKKGGENVRFTVKTPAAPGGSYETSEIDHAIAFKALESMRDDGRAVLIVAAPNDQITDPDARKEAYNSAAKRKFYFSLYHDYNVVEHLTVDGALYAKQGAGWPVDVIVIQGRGTAARELPAANLPKLYASWTELAGLLDRVGTRPDGLVPRAARSDRSGGGAPSEQPGAEPVLPRARPAGEKAGAVAAERPAKGGRGAGEGGPAQRVPGEPGRRPAGARDGQPPPAGPPTGDAGTGGVAVEGRGEPAGTPATRAGQPGGVAKRGDASTAGQPVTQVPYQPQSKSEPLTTLVPVNLSTAVRDSLEALEDRIGKSVDDYVAEKLNYTPTDLKRYFAAEQIDALGLAIDNMDRGAGFIIGDQTGIGKGRVVAGVIRYALQKGQVPIFVTDKPNLYADMYRDLSDIGMADFEPFMTNASQKVPLDDDGTKVLKTGDGKAHAALMTELMEKGALEGYDGIFTTYNQMQTVAGKPTVRQAFLRAFASKGFVIFDESHNAGGTEPNQRSKQGKQGFKEGRAGFARGIAGQASAVFYSSATYAKRPSVMDLYFKTDMRLAVDNITKLGQAIAAGGVPLQQAVAGMLTRAGQYIRRERSFDGINYNTVEAPVDRAAAEHFSTFLREINNFDNLWKKAAVKQLKEQNRSEAKKVTEDGSIGQAGVYSTNFTSIMHNLVEQFLLALKVKPATDLALEHLKRGEKVVLTVANTMGSFLKDFADENGINNGDAIDLSFRDLLVKYLDNSRRVHIKDAFGRGTVMMLDQRHFGPTGWNEFQTLKKRIQDADFGDTPISPIDYIRSTLKRAGHGSDEITGRGAYLEYRENGPPLYRIRPGKEVSIAGRREALARFNGGKTNVLVLNQAGSTGLSLHASEKFADKRKRRMLLVQPERNIDTHMQMLGRINRTGQVVLPEYDQLVADIPAEKRPAAVLAKKMASLNANTTASRGGAMTSTAVTDFMNDYGDEVVARIMNDDPDLHKALGRPLEFDDATGEYSDEDAIRRVTGRIPLLKLSDQEELYDMIESEYRARVAMADAMGENMLEAKTLPLEAKTLGRVKLFDGKGDSPFQEPSHLEVVDAKRLGKPYTTKQLASLVRKELGLPDDAPAEAVHQAARKRRQDALHGIDVAYGPYLQEQISGEEDERKADTIRVRLSDMRRRVEELLGETEIGTPVLLVGKSFSFPAVVTKVEKKGTTKNPVGLGAWKVTFAVPDAARHVTLSFRDLGGMGTDSNYQVGYYDSYRQRGVDPDTVEEVFERAQTQSREVRYIAVGNMLAAFSKVEKGTIVNYTDDEGNVKQGILMPKAFTPKEIAPNKEGFDTPEQVVKYFRLADKGRVVGMGGDLVIAKRGDDFAIGVPKSKERGGEVFLDEGMRKAVGNFVSSGSFMRARFDRGTLPEVVKVLFEKGITLVADADQEAAQNAKGKKVDELGAGLEQLGEIAAKARGDAKLAMAGLGERTPTVQIMQTAMSKVGRERFAAAAERHIEATQKRLGRALTADEEAFAVEATARSIVNATVPSNEGAQADETEIRYLAVALDRIAGASKPSPASAYQAAPLPSGIARIADALGVRAYGFRTTADAAADPQGVFLADRIWINVEAKRPALAILFHEVTHKLRKDDPALYNEFVDAVRPYVQNYPQWFKRLSDMGYGKHLQALEQKNDEIREEFMAEIAADGSQHESFWQTLGRHNPTLLQRVVDMVRSLIEQVRAALGYDPKMGRYLTDYDRVMRIAGAVMAKYQAKRGAAGAVPKFALNGLGAPTPEEAQERARPLLERMRGVVKSLDRAIEPIGRLPDHIAYLKDRYKTQGTIDLAKDPARLFYDTFESASESDKAAIFGYLTNRDASPGLIRDPVVRQVAERAKAMILDIGESLVQAGLMREETMQKRQGAYLPQLYLRSLLSEKDYAALGTGKKPSDMGYLKARKIEWNVSEEGELRLVSAQTGRPLSPEQVLRLGPITDPGYLSAVAVTRAIRDMAILDWLGKISRNREWVIPNSVVQFDGQRVTPWWLKSEAAQLRRQVPYYNEADAQAARELADRMDDVANEAVDDLTWDEKEWAQIPNTARYGRLRGLVVRREIYEDIVGTSTFMSAQASAAEKVLGYGGALTKANQFWKAMKVSMNLPAQVRNGVSNLVLLHLSGVSMFRVLPRIAQAAAAMRQNAQVWQDARARGIGANTFAAQELIRIETELLKLQRARTGPLAWAQALKIIAGTGMNKASDLYQATESLFKLAKIIDEVKKGKSMDDAVIEANKWLFDYSLVSQSVRYLRNAPVGAPFLTFQVKVVPRLMEVALHAPWRFLPYVALAYSMPMIVASMLGVTPDDLDKLKKLLPEAWQDKGHVYVLPWKDSAGRWQVLDLSYFLPWAIYDQALWKAVAGKPLQAVKAINPFGGLLPSIIAAVSTGRDPFTDREIAPKGAPPATQVAAWMTYALNLTLPTMFSSYGTIGLDFADPSRLLSGALPQAITGETNRYGDPRATAVQAAGKPLGVNIRGLSPETDRAQKLKTLQREVQDVRMELRTQLQDQSLTPQQRQKVMLKYTNEVIRRAKELEKFEKETRLPKVLQ